MRRQATALVLQPGINDAAMITWRSTSQTLLAVCVLYGCSRSDPNADSAGSDTSPPARAAESQHEDAFAAAARTLIDFLRGNAEFGAPILSDTVTLHLAPEGGGGLVRVPASNLRDRTEWRIRSATGQTYALVPPAAQSRLTTRFGRHLKCFEYALDDDFPELAHFPHVGTRLEPENMTSCLQTWNLTFVFQPDTMPPKLVAVVYDQWEW